MYGSGNSQSLRKYRTVALAPPGTLHRTMNAEPASSPACCGTIGAVLPTLTHGPEGLKRSCGKDGRCCDGSAGVTSARERTAIAYVSGSASISVRVSATRRIMRARRCSRGQPRCEGARGGTAALPIPGGHLGEPLENRPQIVLEHRAFERISNQRVCVRR